MSLARTRPQTAFFEGSRCFAARVCGWMGVPPIREIANFCYYSQVLHLHAQNQPAYAVCRCLSRTRPQTAFFEGSRCFAAHVCGWMGVPPIREIAIQPSARKRAQAVYLFLWCAELVFPVYHREKIFTTGLQGWYDKA